MSLDAVCLRAIVEELRPQITGARIDKVQQPAKDQIVLLLRGSQRLLLAVGAQSPRLQLTVQTRENPASPPMFCMLLRKHLIGGHILKIEQPGLERLASITIAITDELGNPSVRRLVLELMGRYSNLILLDGEDRILDCLRRVDIEMSPQRQLLPGLFYRLPLAPAGKIALTDWTRETFLAGIRAANPEKQLDAFLMEGCFGLSPLLARELAFRAADSCDAHLGELDEIAAERFWKTVETLQNAIKENDFTPVCLQEKEKMADFSYLPILQYGSAREQSVCESFSQLLDRFYETRERQERNHRQGQEVTKNISNAKTRIARKLLAQEKEYAATEEREELRICGELLTANLHLLERGASKCTLENYYGEPGETKIIPLDPLLTPQQNAAKYYKRYQKAKTAQHYLTEQMERGRQEISYLESVLEELLEAEGEQDFAEIRAELRAAGYLKQLPREKKEPKRAFRPREFKTASGLRILVGRNNQQNDRLTHDADKRDLWFHAQKIHGAHVLLQTEGRAADEESVLMAAGLAAFYSEAKESGGVSVDYTAVRNVKKPAGARPGMVIYSGATTVFAAPDGQKATAPNFPSKK